MTCDWCIGCGKDTRRLRLADQEAWCPAAAWLRHLRVYSGRRPGHAAHACGDAALWPAPRTCVTRPQASASERKQADWMVLFVSLAPQLRILTVGGVCEDWAGDGGNGSVDLATAPASMEGFASDGPTAIQWCFPFFRRKVKMTSQVWLGSVSAFGHDNLVARFNSNCQNLEHLVGDTMFSCGWLNGATLVCQTF